MSPQTFPNRKPGVVQPFNETAEPCNINALGQSIADLGGDISKFNPQQGVIAAETYNLGDVTFVDESGIYNNAGDLIYNFETNEFTEIVTFAGADEKVKCTGDDTLSSYLLVKLYNATDGTVYAAGDLLVEFDVADGGISGEQARGFIHVEDYSAAVQVLTHDADGTLRWRNTRVCS